MDIILSKSKDSKDYYLPPIKIPYLNLRDNICNTPSTDTGRHSIKYIATARTNRLYKLLGINDEGRIYANIDAKLEDLSKDDEFKKLTDIERTDFFHHFLSYLATEISQILPKRVRRDVQIPKLKSISKYSELYNMTKMYYRSRKHWKKWKQSWFEKSIIITKFLLINNCDIKSLTSKLKDMNISLEHILIYCIQHKTSPTILKKLNHIDITLKSIRSYRYPLTPGWLKRAIPYTKPALINSLKRKEIHNYLKLRKRHRSFVKNLRKKIRQKKRNKKLGMTLPSIDSSYISPTTSITLSSDPFSGIIASAN